MSEARFEGPPTNIQYLRLATTPAVTGSRPFNATYATSQYLHHASDEGIESFLQSSPLYDIDAAEWTDLVPLKYESDIHARLHHIVQAILDHFGNACRDDRSSREIRRTHYKGLSHVESHPVQHTTTPAMVVKATGPSFENPEVGEDSTASTLAYNNVASCFDIYLEETLCLNDQFYADENAIFARQMFIQQPNRRFVRNLMMSEEVCYLYHFDRSGAQYTLPVNIHEDPATFIRLILGLSSPDEAELGFDTSVQWVIQNGRKVSGTITVTNVEGVATVYQLLELAPVFRRYEIEGRGTTGWRALAPDGTEVFIKDCWRPDGGPAEYKILQETLGVDGAAQMRNYEAKEVTTAQIRAGGCDDWSLENFGVRVSTRIVMEAYGDSILFFKSQKQLIAALRDAIAAHCTLVNERDVLHRDISQNNILLGSTGAKPGKRGVVVDFDMASKGRRPLEQAPSDHKVGTLAFMSVALLSSSTSSHAASPNHNQLDDLESFYYALYDLVNSWEGVGVQVIQRPWEVTRWDESLDHHYCAATKMSHFWSTSGPEMGHIAPFWLPAIRKLIVDFYTVLRALILLKLPMHNLNSDAKRVALRDLLATANDYYERVLCLFDKALEDLAIQEPMVDISTASDPSTLSANPASATSCKRAAPSDFDAAPAPRKRSRKDPPPQFSPPRTRAYTKAAAARAAEALRILPSTSHLANPLQFSPPRTRARARAALLQQQATVTETLLAPAQRQTSLVQTSKTVPTRKGRKPSARACASMKPRSSHRAPPRSRSSLRKPPRKT